VPRKDLINSLTEVTTDQFAEHIAKVGRYGEIALLEKLFGLQAWPAAVNIASFYRTAQHEHDIAVAMIGAGIAILFHRAAELRHRDEYDILHSITHVANESGERRPELSQHIIQLTVFVAVMIPTSDVRERDFHSGICFNQPRGLL